jgi:hypothetical protein
MRKTKTANRDPDMLPEYDFSTGKPNKYARRFAADTRFVLLAPDLAEFFPDAESVNAALRALVKIARKTQRPAS